MVNTGGNIINISSMNAYRPLAKIFAATPMRKFGEISDLIGTLMWLADDSASGFVTGTVIPVDGGFSAYSGV